jgi:L-glutamine:2-deoxy-scyllo-inosose/3-amino-2,3-dideoxy-scyllo-inosose aminotransferase
MQEKLAIQGGTKAMSQAILDRLPAWPPVYPEVPEMLAKVYNSRKWSFNQTYEQQLCKEFSAYQGAKLGVYMVNGTATLETALAALGVGKGDEVIVPSLTWLATAMAAVYVGATPVFVDIEPDTMCMDPEKVKAAITPKTKAIIPVHLYGSMADLDAILDIAKKHNLVVIEDCAHAHGGEWNGRGVGSWGNVGSFSFQESKTLCSGEGGMCITNDEELAAKMYRLKHIGYDFMSAKGKAGSPPPVGLICHNYRGTEFESVVLLGGLKRLREQTELRDANVKYLGELIADIPGIKLQKRGRKANLQGYYALGIHFDLAQFNNVSLGRFCEILQAEGLGVYGTYGPVYRHMLWSLPESMYRKADACKTCDEVCNSYAVLMHHWLLADKETMKAIADTLRKVWQHRSELV